MSNPFESVIRVTILGLFETFVCGHEGSHYTRHITHITKAGKEKAHKRCVVFFIWAGCDKPELRYLHYYLKKKNLINFNCKKQKATEYQRFKLD